MCIQASLSWPPHLGDSGVGRMHDYYFLLCGTGQTWLDFCYTGFNSTALTQFNAVKGHVLLGTDAPVNLQAPLALGAKC